MGILDQLYALVGGNDAIFVFLISMFPWIELRGAIPYGVLKAGMDPLFTLSLSFIANILVIYPSFVFLDFFFDLMKRTPLKRFIEKTQEKARPYVDRYGMAGLALFVAVPLPGTGAYSGALAAHIFGLKNKKAFLSISAGVLSAGIMVTVICLFFRESFGFLLKTF